VKKELDEKRLPVPNDEVTIEVMRRTRACESCGKRDKDISLFMLNELCPECVSRIKETLGRR